VREEDLVTASLEVLYPLQMSWEPLRILREEVVLLVALKRLEHLAEVRGEPAVTVAAAVAVLLRVFSLQI